MVPKILSMKKRNATELTVFYNKKQNLIYISWTLAVGIIFLHDRAQDTR